MPSNIINPENFLLFHFVKIHIIIKTIFHQGAQLTNSDFQRGPENCDFQRGPFSGIAQSCDKYILSVVFLLYRCKSKTEA